MIYLEMTGSKSLYVLNDDMTEGEWLIMDGKKPSIGPHEYTTNQKRDLIVWMKDPNNCKVISKQEAFIKLL